LDGKEIRETDEIEGFEVPGADTVLSPDESKRAGIPDDPDWAQQFEERSLFEVAWYDEFLAQTDLDDDLRKRMEADREAARVYRRDSDAWEPLYARAIEYPASKIFVALREGVLPAKGRLLPAMDQDEALAILEAANRDFFDIPITDIPRISGPSMAFTSKRARQKTTAITIATSPVQPKICSLFSPASDKTFQASSESAIHLS
jgi:hypothetical protein